MTKILVIGAGAIGGFYGGKLTQAGAQVSVVCRSDYEIVKTHGIAIKSCLGDFHFTPHQVLKSAEEFKGEADFILLATKVLPEIDIASLITPALSSRTSIILLQNGIHIEKPVAKLFPNHHLISALAFVCVSREVSGNINHQDYGRLIVGDFPKGVCEKTSELIELWKNSKIPVEASENILEERWKKLVWNAAFNPMSVLAGGVDTQTILDNIAARNLAENVMKEICILAQADGFNLPKNMVEKNIELTLKMKPYKTSMLLDFEAKRKMEVEAILGNAINFAKSKSIAVPHLSSLYGLLSCY